MNRARVAALLHELVDAWLEEEAGAPGAGDAPKPRRARRIPPPSQPVDELAERRAKNILREYGIVETNDAGST
ncbi:hypothetical protein [Pendulispora albinea]|uniref:Uncharacterized protein n=1 Tax=Pendulispora albinea TaxID=2741071 RepID=A0ABZ2LXB2_9BACT